MSDPPVWDVERMRSLVVEWDEALRAEMPAYARLVPEAEDRGSVLRPPAAPEVVADAEERLGVRLPPAYRSFLLVADGADAGAARANHVLRGIGRFEHQFLRAEDVVAFAREERLAWLVGMWRDNMEKFAGEQELPGEDDPVQVLDFDPGSRALLVTAPVQDGIVGLVPFEPEWFSEP